MPKPIFDRIQKKRERVDHATLEILENEGMARLAKTFQKGDIVRYTGKWLRNVGLHSGGPKNGEVQGTSGSFVSVLWSDASEPVYVHPANIELDPRHKKRAYSYDRRARCFNAASAEVSIYVGKGAPLLDRLNSALGLDLERSSGQAFGSSHVRVVPGSPDPDKYTSVKLTGPEAGKHAYEIQTLANRTGHKAWIVR